MKLILDKDLVKRQYFLVNQMWNIVKKNKGFASKISI